MSATSSPPLGPAQQPPSGAPATVPSVTGAGCPLCGAPLAPDQEWCLRCGAAARTRLAASPNWKGPLAVVAAVIVLSLGVLAAALVKLAGDSGPAPPPSTTTLTTPATAPATTPSVPSTATPGTTLPTVPTPGGGTGAAPGATTPTTPTTPTTALPGAKSPLPGAKRKGALGLSGISRALEERILKARK